MWSVPCAGLLLALLLMLHVLAQLDAAPIASSLLGDDGGVFASALARAPEVGGVIAIVLGVVLLAAGARVLSTTVVVACASAAAIGAAMLARGIDPSNVNALAGVPLPALAALVGCVVGGLLGLAVLRLAIGAATSVTFAALALLGTGTFLMAHGAIASLPDPKAPTSAIATELGRGWLASAGAMIGGDASTATPEGSAAAGPREKGVPVATTLAREAAAYGDSYSKGYWNSLAPRARSTLLLATIAGGVVGLALGTLMPRRAASLVTALCGAGGAILGARILTTPGPAEWLEPGAMGPAGWLCIWIGLAIAGMWMQSRLGRRVAAPTASA